MELLSPPSGTPALTSRAMKEPEMRQVAEFIDEGVRVALKANADLATKAAQEREGGKPPTTMTNLKVLPSCVCCIMKLPRPVY